MSDSNRIVTLRASVNAARIELANAERAFNAHARNLELARQILDQRQTKLDEVIQLEKDEAR